MKVIIKSRSGKELLPGGIELADAATLQDLQAAFYKAKPHFYPARQRFSLPAKDSAKRGVALERGKSLKDYAGGDGLEVVFKDLGPQIGYSTVFFWEYFGPLVIYALFYFFPHVLYPGHRTYPQKDIVQTLALAYWSFHYAKRIFETYFVHVFSLGTMPIFNLYKNCGYYWSFAAYVAYFINHPFYTPPPHNRAFALFAFAALCQLANFRCHMILRSLRPKGATGYVIPRGFLFDYITCPNYTAEIYGWLAFAAATQTFAAFLFIAAGGFQMALWAMAKHARLRKTFDGKDGRERYPRRWVMLPPFF